MFERPAGECLGGGEGDADSSPLEHVMAAIAARASGWREALGPEPGVTSARIDAWALALADHLEPHDAVGGAAGPDALDEDELIERIAAAERLKAAASARQAMDSVRLALLVGVRRAADAALSGAEENVGRQPDPSLDVAARIALARQESPAKGGQLLGLAQALVKEMPHTLNALAGGRINEWRATLVVRETACLSVEDRVRVDEALVPVYAREGVGDRQLAAEAKKTAQRLDPAAAANRARRAVSERRVSVRPAPDSMAYLTCLLPAAHAIAAHKALVEHADGLRSAGPADDAGRSPGAVGAAGASARTRDQIMADTLVERLTGQAKASDVRLEVQLLMTDAALLSGSSEPAELPGYGVIPAQVARDLVAGSEQEASLRRLYAAPSTGTLVAMESRARIFPEGLKRLIAARDRTCRNPWCDAPLRQFDHVVPAARRGPTAEGNGQGLCERCNQTKEAPGWSEATVPATRHTVEVRTPTGETYRSTAPPLPGTREILYHRVDFDGGEYVFQTVA
ncbi:HNH endonuclease [Sinomonas mesophila]|uniref:HNH endonuclease n=1 Tax=Sinomonas mesophila TaxID=1531955 RepID=UPI001FEC2014|nr:HNH endonuclease signature motif containing protein [Sinomonas mesophila]